MANPGKNAPPPPPPPLHPTPWVVAMKGLKKKFDGESRWMTAFSVIGAGPSWPVTNGFLASVCVCVSVSEADPYNT